MDRNDRQLCEDSANHITKQIALMERYGEVDEEFHFSWPLAIAKTQHEQYAQTIEHLLTLVRFNDDCRFLQATWEYIQIKRHFPEKIQLERRVELLREFPPHWPDRPDVREEISNIATWRQVRQEIWELSDNLAYFVDFSSETLKWRRGGPNKNRQHVAMAGRPVDIATAQLLVLISRIKWETRPVTIAELARILVEEDLDRSREGTKAARIRREKKRLNKAEKTTKEHAVFYADLCENFDEVGLAEIDKDIKKLAAESITPTPSHP